MVVLGGVAVSYERGSPVREESSVPPTTRTELFTPVSSDDLPRRVQSQTLLCRVNKKCLNLKLSGDEFY